MILFVCPKTVFSLISKEVCENVREVSYVFMYMYYGFTKLAGSEIQ
jgi:hypothetical protein